MKKNVMVVAVTFIMFTYENQHHTYKWGKGSWEDCWHQLSAWLCCMWCQDDQSAEVKYFNMFKVSLLHLHLRNCTDIHIWHQWNMSTSHHGNSFRINGGFPSQMASDVSFDVSLNKWLNKPLSCWWFELSWWSCNITVMDIHIMSVKYMLLWYLPNVWLGLISRTTSWISWPRNFVMQWEEMLRYPDSKVHGANMGPTWVLSAPDGPHIGPMNFAIWDQDLGPGFVWYNSVASLTSVYIVLKFWANIYA